MTRTAETYHVPVLLNESIEGLNLHAGGIYVDVTFGGGGHSREILSHLEAGSHLYSFYQDADAEQNIGRMGLSSKQVDRFTFIRSNFRYLKNWMRYYNVPHIDGLLADLGVSSHHFDDETRGFSFRFEAPLDMRMDKRQDFTAKDLINSYSEAELYHIIRDYGEDKFAKNIAKHIVLERAKKPIETTFELSEVISHAIPMKMRVQGGHPAKKTFQAIRIALNRELEVLEESLDGMIKALKPGGRLCIITFHSLEDRIVKRAFRTAEDPCICPKDFPICTCGRKSLGKVISKKAILPSDLEREENPRSKSAKLRIFERGE